VQKTNREKIDSYRASLAEPFRGERVRIEGNATTILQAEAERRVVAWHCFQSEVARSNNVFIFRLIVNELQDRREKVPS
jgi:hypothetical protein